MKIQLRSASSTGGRRMAAARALWRANGMTESQMGRPVIAVVNSFTEFVPGHVHLAKAGRAVKEEIERLGCFAPELNTIAIDDGIAMGHEGMLYSLPSRELIADSVEYMLNAHCADAMVCISNCDKVTPGMLLAAMRLNIPAVFVSGGPMEAGRVDGEDVDLVDIMVEAADPTVSDERVERMERDGCPTCGCCSGMFTANSMNSLTEAIGLALAGNGTVLSTHREREELMRRAARQAVANTLRYYEQGDTSVLPRSIASREAMLNAMTLDIAMGGSTNTVLHLLAVAHEGGIDFTLDDVDALSRRVPVLCKVAPNSRYHIQDVNRAGGIPAIMAELRRAGLLNEGVVRVDSNPAEASSPDQLWTAAPSGEHTRTLGGSEARYKELDTDREKGCIRSVDHAYAADGGLGVLRGNIAPDGAVVKTAGVPKECLRFSGRAHVFESQEEAMEAILADKVKAGEVVVIRYEGPRGGPGMQEMLYPTSYLKSKHLGRACALITDGRFSGGTSGLSLGHISPEAAAGGNIALVRDGDIIDIDIPARSINVRLSQGELARRRAEEEARGDKAFTPHNRNRQVSGALRAYASMVSSADKGAALIR